MSFRLRKNCDKLKNFDSLFSQKSDLSFLSKLITTIKNIDEVLSNRTRNILLAFNGGKDSIVVLLLVRNRLKVINETRQNNNKLMLYTFDITNHDTFEEIESYKSMVVSCLGLNHKTFVGQMNRSMYRNVESFYKNKLNDENLLIVLGCRKCDNNKFELIQQSSYEGTNFIRFHPIVYWNYQEVWKFILIYEVPFCSLYLKGYSSIGEKSYTKKNIYLLDNNLKAFQLPEAEWNTERTNRY